MSKATKDLGDAISREGFAVAPGVLDATVVRALVEEIEERLPQVSAAGVRRLCEKVPGVLDIARSKRIRALIEPVLGPGARLVRSIFFCKDEMTNWQVAWHQDLSIAVRERADVEGFVAWSMKDGLVHVQPPTTV